MHLFVPSSSFVTTSPPAASHSSAVMIRVGPLGPLGDDTEEGPETSLGPDVSLGPDPSLGADETLAVDPVLGVDEELTDEAACAADSMVKAGIV